jgi:hypothetical protein
MRILFRHVPTAQQFTIVLVATDESTPQHGDYCDTVSNWSGATGVRSIFLGTVWKRPGNNFQDRIRFTDEVGGSDQGQEGVGRIKNPTTPFILSAINSNTGSVAIISGDFSYCVALPAAKGAQFLDLTGSSDTATGVQTKIKTQPGATYSLTFYVGNIVGGGNCGTTSTVDLVIDGSAVGSFTNEAGKQSDTIVWKKFSTEFTAVNNTTTIAFLNGDQSDDTANGLDGVSVKLVTAP